MSFPFPTNPVDKQEVTYRASNNQLIKAKFNESRNEWVVAYSDEFIQLNTNEIYPIGPATQDDELIVWDQSEGKWVVGQITLNSLANVNYVYPGGVEQTIQKRLEQYVSVKDFGAKGDDSNDDRERIQTAMDTCAAKGVTLFFPPGIYVLNSIGGTTPVVRLDGTGSNNQAYCLNYPNGLRCSGSGAILKRGSNIKGIGDLAMTDDGTADNAMDIPIAVNIESSVSKIYWDGINISSGFIIGLGNVNVGSAINNCHVRNSSFTDCGIGILGYGFDRVDFDNLRFPSCQAGLVVGGMYFTVSDVRDNKSHFDKCSVDNHYYIFASSGYGSKAINIDKYFDKYFYKNNQSIPAYDRAAVVSGDNSTITKEGKTLIDDAIADGLYPDRDSAVTALIDPNPRVQGLGTSSGTSNQTYRGISGFGFVGMSRYSRSATAPVIGKLYMQHGWRSCISFDTVSNDFGHTLKVSGEDNGWINPDVTSSASEQRWTWGDIQGQPLIDNTSFTASKTYSDPYQGRGIRFPYFVKAGDGSVSVFDCSYNQTQFKKRYLPYEASSKIAIPQLSESNSAPKEFPGGVSFGNAAQGSATSLILSNYERGTWTPVLVGVTGMKAVSSIYEIIGETKMISVSFRIDETSSGSLSFTSTDIFEISGVPLNVSSQSVLTNKKNGNNGWSAVNAGIRFFTAKLEASDQTIRLFDMSTGAAVTYADMFINATPTRAGISCKFVV